MLKYTHSQAITFIIYDLAKGTIATALLPLPPPPPFSLSPSFFPLSLLLPVVLVSDKGDADIYVSTVDREPQSERCEFSSDSCGVDLVVVPAPADTRQGLVRPLYVGVVGLEWHEETRYRLFLITPSSVDIQKYQVRVVH